MLLVPRQLQRARMTGEVPYYGGRMSPAQAYAASHSRREPPPRPPTDVDATLAALQKLVDDGVLTPEEYEQFRSRVTS